MPVLKAESVVLLATAKAYNASTPGYGNAAARAHPCTSGLEAEDDTQSSMATGHAWQQSPARSNNNKSLQPC